MRSLCLMPSFLRSCTLALLLVFAGTAQAASVTLQSLLGGGTITSGNILFSDFSFTALTPVTVDPGSIFVNNNTPGTLEFSGSFAVPTSAGTVFDALLSFKAYSVFGITGVALESTAGTAGTGQAFIGEVVKDATTGAGLGNLANLFNSAITWDSDAISFGQVDSVLVRKDISLSMGSKGVAVLSDFQQTFTTGNGSVIPTPAAGLAGLSLLGLVLATRRRLA